MIREWAASALARLCDKDCAVTTMVQYSNQHQAGIQLPVCRVRHAQPFTFFDIARQRVAGLLIDPKTRPPMRLLSGSRL